MGSELSCPCAGKSIDDMNNPKPTNESDPIQFKTRLEAEDILYNYTYGLTKINLIRTCDLEKFFNSRSLLKLQNRKEVKISLNIKNFIFRVMIITIKYSFQITWVIKILQL